MARQTTLNGNGRGTVELEEPPVPSVGDVSTHATDLVHDIITLVELQFKLLYVDIRDVLTQGTGGVVLLCGMVALLLGCVPVLLVAVAELIVQSFAWSRPAAYASVSGAAGTVAIVVGLVTVRRLRSVGAVLARSHAELLKNLDFLKSLTTSRPSRR